jgi:hypothetical protein
MKNVLFKTPIGSIFLKLDKNIAMINAKTQSRFYKFLIKGDKAQCTTHG